MQFNLLLQLQVSSSTQELSEKKLDFPSYAAEIPLMFETALHQEMPTTGRVPVQDCLNQYLTYILQVFCLKKKKRKSS